MSGWIEWNGGECPVAGVQVVEWRSRDGNAGHNAAGDLDWRHMNITHVLSSGDIIAFRLSSQPESA